ncbi:MAG: uroporphyrinogen decarboxylase family protein [Planctomycetota bacterium]|nr:uroporphyrinogen decarboxylase family protein [Planctomycetota bacterium]
MKASMTSKERVLCSLAWKEPDRVPIQIYLTPEMKEKLEVRLGTKDILRALGVDFRTVAPKYMGKIKEPRDGLHFDMWGTGYRRISNAAQGTYDEAVELPLARLKTLDDVEKYPWPGPDDFDYSTIPDQCRKLEAGGYAICLGGAGFPDIVNGVSRGRGMEQVLTDIMTGDEVGMAIIDRRVDICYGILRRGLEAARGKVDILCLGEDCGTQNGRLFSPRKFDDVFRPRLKRFYDLAHEFGAKAMMHSCGDTHEVMPAFVEMGLDILDAMQPEPPGMNPEKIRAAWKGKLAFCGLISTQKTLPFGTEEECRAEARHRLDVIARGGGYIFSPAHCIQPDTPVENVLAVYEEALGRKFPPAR